YVCYIEKLIVGPTGKTDVQSLPNRAMSAIAAANIFGTHLLSSAWGRDCRSNSTALFDEADQLRLPLDTEACLLQLLNKKSLMIVLRICQGERIGTDAVAEILEADGGYFSPAIMVVALAD